MWAFVFPRYISDPELGIHFGRARGPMLQSARFGVYLIVCLTATWLTWGWRSRLGLWGRLVAVALVPLYVAAIYFTYTRSVWIGAGLAVFMGAAFLLHGRWRTLVLGGMIAASLLVLLAKGEQLVAFKREYSAAETRESTYMRASFSYVSWKMFQARPLTGYGFGQYTYENQPFLSDRSTSLHLESIRGYVHHNTLLSMLVEQGLVGLLVYLTVLIYWIRCGWQVWRNPKSETWMKAHSLLLLTTFAAHFLQLLFRDVSYSPVENALVFMLAGMAMNVRAKLAEATAPVLNVSEPQRAVEKLKHLTWQPPAIEYSDIKLN